MKPPPPVPKKIAPFRIEVREAATPVAWWIIEFAYTETQRDAMKARRVAEYGETNVRAQDNASLLDWDALLRYVATESLDPLAAVCEFVVAEKLVDKLEADKAIAIAKLKTPEELLADMGSIIRGALPPGYPPAVPVSVPAAAAAEISGEKLPVAAPDSAAAMVELPFKVDAILDDKYVEDRQVRVTKIHSEDGTGRAFDWEDLDPESLDKTGTCPIASVECFTVAHDAKTKRPKKKKD